MKKVKVPVKGAKKPGIRFVTEYVHYRTKKLMKAEEYGYRAWPLGKGRAR